MACGGLHHNAGGNPFGCGRWPEARYGARRQMERGDRCPALLRAGHLFEQGREQYRRFDVVLPTRLVSKGRMKPSMALFLLAHAFAVLACTSQQPGVIEVPPEGAPSIPGP